VRITRPAAFDTDDSSPSRDCRGPPIATPADIAMRKRAASREPGRPRHQTRERAKHLLVHRANGGIHNAAIALKLVTERLPSTGSLVQDTASFVAAGVRGTASAARALQLLGALVGLESASAPSDANAFVDDIAKILHAESRRHGIAFQMDMANRGPAAAAIRVEDLADILIAGLSAVEDAVPNSAIRIRAREGTSPSDMPLALEIEVAPHEAA